MKKVLSEGEEDDRKEETKAVGKVGKKKKTEATTFIP